MDQLQVNELKESYYEYIVKVPQGLQTTVSFLENNELEKAFNGLVHLSEGLGALLKIEEALAEQGMTINSRILEALTLFADINKSLENQDYILLKDLLEYEIIPIFSSSSEWIFQKEVK